MKGIGLAMLVVILPAIAHGAAPHPSCRPLGAETCTWQLVKSAGEVVISGMTHTGCQKQLQFYPDRGARCVQR